MILRLGALLGPYSNNLVCRVLNDISSQTTLDKDSTFNYVLYEDVLKFLRIMKKKYLSKLIKLIVGQKMFMLKYQLLILKVNLLPLVISLSTKISPLWASIICFEIAKPRPDPDFDLEESDLKNLSNMKGKCSSIIPSPSSETENRVDNITQIRQAQSLSYSANQSEEISLTHVCRQQLIKPLLDILSRQTKLGESKESISVFGNVFFPGDYPVSKNMTIEDALNAAGGLKDASYTSQIEHIKRVKQEKEFRYLASDSSIDDISKSKIRLNPADQVNVKKISKNIQTVSISESCLNDIIF